MDFPNPTWPVFNTIHSLGPESYGNLFSNTRTGSPGSGPVSGAFTANLAHYVPFRLWVPATALKMTYIVGATANGNVDLGIYSWEKNRLVNSGSTAQGTANTVQEVDITDTLLMPGRYFMAIQGSSGTGTMFRQGNPDENILGILPIYDQAVGSFGLPATAAFTVTTQGTTLVPVLAVHFDATV